MDEFEIIDAIFRPLTDGNPGAFELDDDAAVLQMPPGKELVTTVDAIIAGVHYLPDDPPERIAQKLLRINLSDLAAMGAAPAGYLLTCAYNRDTGIDWIKTFAEGLAADQREFGIKLLGGDTVRGEGPDMFSLTALGTVEAGKAWRRNTAKPGQSIYVTGTIGDAALGLQVLKEKLASNEPSHLIDRYQVPQPRLTMVPQLMGRIAAATDVSDGLLADLNHICRASNVAALVHRDRVPLSGAAQALITEFPALWTMVLGGGDDYELVLTMDEGPDSPDLPSDLTWIGQIVDGQGVTVIDPLGNPLPYAVSGYKHF